MLAGKSKIFTLIFALSFALAGCSKGPAGWWASVNQKAKHLSELEAKYQALQQEHETLKREHYRLTHEHDSLLAEYRSKRNAEESLAATGSVSGRAPASIGYKVPNLSPEALKALGYEHLREQRFAEAAVTFEALLAMPEGAAVQGADVYYSAGVAWFQVQNFTKARESFDAAKAHADADEKERVRKKVELWMRVIDRKLASDRMPAQVKTPVVKEHHENHGGHHE